MKNININQIKSNIDKLSNIYLKLKVIWENINPNQIKHKVYLKTDPKYNKIKAKFGRDFNGAKQLAMLLKSEADATEYRELILPIVAPLVQARKDGRGGALVSSSSSSSS